MVLPAASSTVFASDSLIMYRNLALGADVIANSRYSDGYHESNLVDGNYQTTYSDTAAVTFTDMPTIPRNAHYAVIDLGSVCKIYNIIIYTRTDVTTDASRKNLCVEVTNDPTLQTWTTVAFNELVSGVGSSWRIDFDEPIEYRYVKPCQRPNTTTFNAVALGEVEIYGERAVQSNGSIEDYKDIEADGELYNATKLLGYLEIMTKASDSSNEFGVNMLVTRAEAADIAVRASNSTQALEAELTEDVFLDVTAETRYANAVKLCKDYGIVSDSEYFYPEEYVTVSEFVKMTLSAMGYGHYAERLGGYPTGYMLLAKKISIDIWPEDMSASDYISRGDVAKILYKALNSSAMEITGTTGSDVNYEESKSFLESSFGYILKRGIVTANNVSNLKTDSGLGSGRVAIDGVIYMDENDLFTTFLGYEVYYLEGDDRSIGGGWQSRAVKVKTLQSKDIIKVANGSADYYDENGKRKKCSLSPFSRLNVLKNGVAFNDYTEESFVPKYGKLKLIDADLDGVFETADIMEPTVVIANYATDDMDAKKLILNGYNKTSLDIDYTNLFIYRRGEPIAIDSIGSYNTIYAYVSENEENVILEVCDTIVSGQINSLNNEKITIGGETYEFSDYYNDNKSKMGTVSISTGREATLLVNEQGEVVWIVDAAHAYSGELVAVVLACGRANNTLSNYEFKIFDESGEIRILESDDRISVDGGKYDADKLDTFLSSNPEYFKNTLAYVRINDAGKLVSVRTSNYEDNKEIVKSISCTNGYYKTETAITYQAEAVIPLNKDIKLFTIPVDENGDVLKYGYDKFYSVSTLNTELGTGTRVITTDIDMFGKGEYGEPYYAVRKEKFVSKIDGVRPVSSNNGLSVMLVETAWNVLDSYENTGTYIEGYDITTGKKVSVEFDHSVKYTLDSFKVYCTIKSVIDGLGKATAEWYKNGFIDKNYIISKNTGADLMNYCSDIKNIKKGDIIYYRKSGNAGIEIERVYDYNYLNGKSPYDRIFVADGTGLNVDGFTSNRRLLHYKLTDINAEAVTLSSDSASETLFYGNLTAKMFAVRENTIEVIDKALLPSFVEIGCDVAAYSQSGVYKAFVFYEN